MKKRFKIEKLELDSFINLLMELYDSGVDYVDLFSDNSDDKMDKLIIQTREEYMNPEWIKQHPEETKMLRLTTGIETTKLSEEGLNDLI